MRWSTEFKGFDEISEFANDVFFAKTKNFKEFLVRMNYHEKILEDIGVNYAENEVSMPKGFMKRKKEIKEWYKHDQHIDVKKNRLLKQSKRK